MAFRPKFLAALTSNHEALAEAYLKEGDKARAAAAYARAGRLADAARLAAASGDATGAVEYTMRAVLGQVPAGYVGATPQQAGELLASAGHHKEAILLFELGAAWKQAAESAAKLQLPARAARFYEKGRLWRLAALYYGKANQPNDAARALELESNRLKGEGRARREPGVEKAIGEVDQERAEILGRLGKSSEASALLTGTTPTLKSGKLHESAGRFEEAIHAYLAVGEQEDALRLLPRASALKPVERARILLNCGRPRDAAGLFAAAGALKEAAAAWETTGEPAQAARCWEEAKQPLAAAENYRKAGRWADAGRNFDEAGAPERAGEAFLMTKDYRRAGDSLLKAGKAFEAASCFLEIQAKDDASRALKRVPAGTQLGARATMLLVPLLYEQGNYSDALQRLQMLPPATDPGGTTLVEQLYWQARLLERLNRGSEALATFQKVVAIQPDYRDAADRLAGLKSATGRLPLSPPLPRSPTSAAGAAAAGANDGAGSTEGSPVVRPVWSGGSAAFPPGFVLAGRYEILGELGRGGMGRVYRARDRELADEVAIKTILGGGEEALAEQDRLLREVQLLRRLTHPNIVRVHDLGRFEAGIFVTMELVAGQSLDQALKTQRQPPLDRVRSILKQIAAGLEEAHAHGIVHRDLKPGNVMLTPTRVKLLDFGIARAIHSDVRLTVTGLAVGTPMYMAPEQIQGASVDGRCDLYSLGVLAFTLLAGREPFLGATPTAIALQHLQSSPPDLRKLRPDLPSAWATLTESLLAKEPENRPASAGALGDLLDRLPV